MYRDYFILVLSSSTIFILELIHFFANLATLTKHFYLTFSDYGTLIRYRQISIIPTRNLFITKTPFKKPLFLPERMEAATDIFSVVSELAFTRDAKSPPIGTEPKNNDYTLNERLANLRSM